MAYAKCNLATCATGDGTEHMTRVEVVIDGAPVVGYGCSPDHADQLLKQWATGDRYSQPVDDIWATVGNGRVAA